MKLGLFRGGDRRAAWSLSVVWVVWVIWEQLKRRMQSGEQVGPTGLRVGSRWRNHGRV
jgi:hypothetical protein